MRYPFHASSIEVATSIALAPGVNAQILVPTRPTTITVMSNGPKKALSGAQIGGMGPGVIKVKWIEKYPGAAASYTLYLQVARQ